MARTQTYPVLFRITVLALIIMLFTVGCASKADSGELMIEKDLIDAIPVNGGTYRVLVRSGEVWTATASDSWFRTEKSDRGVTRTIVTIVVEPNMTTNERSGQLTFTTEAGASKAITLKQRSGDIEPDMIDYRLPVVFHILYSDQSKQEDKPSGEYIATLMEKVNKYYRPVGDPRFGELQEEDRLKLPRDASDTNRPNMGVEFVMAQSAPDGKPLPIPGINRIKVDAPEIKYQDVLYDKKGGIYQGMAWDRSKYINVFLFRFKRETQGDGNAPVGGVHGAAFLPSLVKGKNIPGFSDYDARILDELNHCIVINTVAFHKEENTQRELYNPAATLSHELGHYLGLYHTFSENEQHNALLDDCVDSDHCDDTPSYNRKAYEVKRLQYGSKDRLTPLQFDELLQRTSCAQKRYYATNIMDYDICHQDAFTADQRKRIRTALYYSPLIPGPKFFSKEELRSEGGEIVHPPVVVCGPHHNH